MPRITTPESSWGILEGRQQLSSGREDGSAECGDIHILSGMAQPRTKDPDKIDPTARPQRPQKPAARPWIFSDCWTLFIVTAGQGERSRLSRRSKVERPNAHPPVAKTVRSEHQPTQPTPVTAMDREGVAPRNVARPAFEMPRPLVFTLHRLGDRDQMTKLSSRIQPDDLDLP
jgi:hypothetical protein